MHQPGTEDAYKHYVGEAAISKCLRNIMGVGMVGVTAAMNTAEMTQTQHLEVTAGGLVFAAGTAYIMERCRRQAIHDSRVEAAIAHVHANQSGHPVPSWAQGNAGDIL